jgi:hypothetical protein
MTGIVGVDPGIGGAIAVWLPATQTLALWDMPTRWQGVRKEGGGQAKRRRIDEQTLWAIIAGLKDRGVTIAVIEDVAGKGRQPGSSGFVFGYTAGLVYMACVAAGIRPELAHPATWKRFMSVPGKGVDGKKPDEIIHRADQIFPNYGGYFRGPNGGKLHDRAEAALLAKFGEDYVLKKAEALAAL